MLMFPHRIAMLFSPRDVDEAATTIVDLDMSEVISRIFIKFKATNFDTTNINIPQANITKVELIDGSDVQWTGTGKAIDAASFYDRKVPELHSFNYTAGQGAEAMLCLNFGRYPYDRVYALDPKRFRNLQLRITHDENLCNAGCIVNEMTVWAEVFSKTQPSPIGMFSVKEQYAYTAVAGSYEEIDLPTDAVIRTLYLDALLTNQWLSQEINEVRLDEDNLKTIMYDGQYSELMRMYRPYFGKYEHKVMVRVEDSPTEFFVAPSQEQVTLLVPYSATAGYVSTFRQFGCLQVAIANTDMYAFGYVSGYIPHGIGAIPFGERQTPEDWYDPRGLKRLRLRLQGGAAATGTYRVSTQQIRMY